MTVLPKPPASAVRRSPLIFDAVLAMQRRGYLQFWRELWEQHGDNAELHIGPGRLFLIVHPEHVRHTAITNRDNYIKGPTYNVVRKYLLGNGILAGNGELWRRQRRLMAPFFSPRGIEQYVDLFVSDGLALTRRWDALAATAELVEMGDEMMRVTASIILRSMFSMQSDEDILELKDAVETMIQFVAGYEMNPLSLPVWVPVRVNRNYKRARERVHTYIDGLIARRRAMPEAERPDDLLTKLMQARDPETGEAMSDTLLRDECITIFFAGHETTARTLTALWYALSEHPDVAQRLHAEVDAVLGDDLPTVGRLKQMPYTLQVIKETLRLWPPAPVYARDAVAEDTFDGRTIPAGARLIVVPYLTHRHPAFWDEPERFDPDRWLPEAEAARHPFAYHPFAAGQRICIGNNFSLLESHILVAILARHFAPRLLPNHTPHFDMAGTMTVTNGMPMFIERR